MGKGSSGAPSTPATSGPSAAAPTSVGASPTGSKGGAAPVVPPQQNFGQQIAQGNAAMQPPPWQLMQQQMAQQMQQPQGFPGAGMGGKGGAEMFSHPQQPTTFQASGGSPYQWQGNTTGVQSAGPAAANLQNYLTPIPKQMPNSPYVPQSAYGTASQFNTLAPVQLGQFTQAANPTSGTGTGKGGGNPIYNLLNSQGAAGTSTPPATGNSIGANAVNSVNPWTRFTPSTPQA